jgi:hypothetical protein
MPIIVDYVDSNSQSQPHFASINLKEINEKAFLASSFLRIPPRPEWENRNGSLWQNTAKVNKRPHLNEALQVIQIFCLIAHSQRGTRKPEL